MTAAKPPAFQVYAKELYTGTSDLSASEFGVLMRALVWSWYNGPLPLDNDRRGRTLLCTPEEMICIWPEIAKFWQQTPGGYINHRLEFQRAELAEWRRQQAEKGRKGGLAKASRRASSGYGPERHPAKRRQQHAWWPESDSSLSDLRLPLQEQSRPSSGEPDVGEELASASSSTAQPRSGPYVQPHDSKEGESVSN